MGTLIVVGVIVLVLLVFVGLVWLFVRIAPPPQPRLPEQARPGKGPVRPGKADVQPQTVTVQDVRATRKATAGQKGKGSPRR